PLWTLVYSAFVFVFWPGILLAILAWVLLRTAVDAIAMLLALLEGSPMHETATVARTATGRRMMSASLLVSAVLVSAALVGRALIYAREAKADRLQRQCRAYLDMLNEGGGPGAFQVMKASLAGDKRADDMMRIVARHLGLKDEHLAYCWFEG